MGVFSRLCTFFPVHHRKVVFCNFNGRGWGGSPKYIAEEILRQGLKYDLVWLADKEDKSIPAGIRQVPMHSPRGRYELSTARVIVNNVKNKLPFTKKRSQYYIQTWHGDFALKFIEKEVEDKLNPGYVAESKADSRETDLILSASRQFSNIVRNSFWYDGEVFECGQPCNDVYFHHESRARDKVKALFHLSDDTKIALYAPTFRDGNLGFEFPDFQVILQNLETLTNNSWALLIRLHPNDQGRVSTVKFTDKVLDGSPYPDTQDLAKAADLLITDYSSIMYDFALQRKPVILFTPDLEAYLQRRGLRDIYWELPFPQVRAKEALEDAIDTVFGSDYSTRLTSFMKERICSYDDGHASERIVDRIRQVVEGSFHHGRTIH